MLNIIMSHNKLIRKMWLAFIIIYYKGDFHMIIVKEKELAEKLGLSPWTVRRMRLQENMPYFKVGKSIFYNFETVCKWIEAKEKETTEEKPIKESQYGKLRVIS